MILNFMKFSQVFQYLLERNTQKYHKYLILQNNEIKTKLKTSFPFHQLVLKHPQHIYISTNKKRYT